MKINKKQIIVDILMGIMLGLLISALASYAAWDKYDTALLVTGNAGILIDWGQTLEIARHPDKYYERNPILGRHPSVGNVNVFGFTNLVVFNSLMIILPDSYRKAWGGIFCLGKVAIIVNNRSIGLKIKF